MCLRIVPGSTALDWRTIAEIRKRDDVRGIPGRGAGLCIRIYVYVCVCKWKYVLRTRVYVYSGRRLCFSNLYIRDFTRTCIICMLCYILYLYNIYMQALYGSPRITSNAFADIHLLLR